MSTTKLVLNKKCFFVLSGVSNPLGKHLAVEMCGRFQGDSLVLLIDDNEENLQETRKEIVALDKGINVVCYNLMDWLNADYDLFHNLLNTVLSTHQTKDGGSNLFDLAFVAHNEGSAATQMLIEPQEASAWKMFVSQTLYAPVALSQALLKSPILKGVQKLVINIKSSLVVRPFVYSSLCCSCTKARNMYFRSMASEGSNNDLLIMSYAPGILETHKPEYDCNNNVINVSDVTGEDDKLSQRALVEPQQSTLKLINILEEISFISGHEVDYYDTFVL